MVDYAARSVIGHDSVSCSDHTHAKLCLRGAVYSHSGPQCQSLSACPLYRVYTCQIWEPELSFGGLENTKHAGLGRLRPSPHACVMSLPGVWDEGRAGVLDWRLSAPLPRPALVCVSSLGTHCLQVLCLLPVIRHLPQTYTCGSRYSRAMVHRIQVQKPHCLIPR